MKRKFPDVLTLLTTFMVCFTVLTWVIPAGQYQRRAFEGRQVVVPGTYQQVEQHGQGLMDFLSAPGRGIEQAAEIIAFVFLVSGAFGIIQETGAIQAFLERMIKVGLDRPQHKLAVIPILMVLFSLGGATFGMSEEVLVFVMLTIPMARALGYDTVVGVSVPFVGAGAGFAGAFINPFTVGIAQGIAGLTPGTGVGYRVVCWSVFTMAAIIFVCLYAVKVERDPSRSLLHGVEDRWHETETKEDLPMTWARRLVLAVLALSLVLLVWGVKNWGWYIQEIAGLFVGAGLLSAGLARLTAERTVKSFSRGAHEVVMAALIIGFSKGLLVIAEKGAIIDTVLHWLAGMAEGFTPAISVLVMFAFQSVLNFFVPSGSGQAALTMPLMAPLSDLLHLQRQVAVLAFQFGDGISNLVIPTSGITMGLLEIAGIPYDRWFRFCFPLVLLLSLLACVLLVLPVVAFPWQ